MNFQNGYFCIVCILVVFEIACMLGGVSLNNNMFRDLLQPTMAGVASLYIILFVGKRIINYSIGKVLAYIGRNSFYIMALHFVGFKLCSLLLINMNLRWVNLSDLTPSVGDNFFMLVLFSLFGIGFPLFFIELFRFSKKRF